MKNLFFIVLLLLSMSIYAQKKSVTFQIKKGNKSLTFKGVNNSDLDQEVVLFFKKIKGLYGYSKPITKIIPAKGRLDFIRLTFNGKYEYNYSYRNSSKPSKQQKIDWKKAIESYTYKEGTDLDKGIVVFSKDGCSRCKITIDYLLKNSIDFQLINISESRKNSKLLWKKLKDKGENLTRVSTPVLIVNGVLHHKFKDLRAFLKTLKDVEKN